jgi:hypothetical protein
MDPVTLGLGGLSVISGLAGMSSANRAARENARATQAAINEQRRQYDTTRADLASYRGLGDYSANALQAGLESGAYNAPEFDFQAKDYSYNAGEDSSLQQALNQANKSLEASAAARGVLGGGGVLRAISKENMGQTAQFEDKAYNRYQTDENTRYGRATDAYNRTYGASQDAANRLMSASNLGMSAATTTGSLGANTANQIGSLGIQGANTSSAYKSSGQEQLFKGLGQGLGYLQGGWQ